MITEFSVSNYRCFSDLNISGLSQINLVVGKNGSGKSALLEGIWLSKSIFPAGTCTDVLRIRDELPEDGASEGDLLSSYKSLYLAQGPFLVSCVDDGDFCFNNVEFNMRPAGGRISIYCLNNGESFPIDIKYILSERDYLIEGIFEPIFIPCSGFNKKALSSFWDRISLTDLEDDVTEVVRLIRPDGRRLAFIGRHPVVQIPRRGPVPMARLGDGVLRAFGIAVAIANSSNLPLFIDEIETGIHYTAMGDLWRSVFHLASKLNVQVFATTHSWDCIKAFGEVAQAYSDTSAQLIRMERDEDDAIRAVQYDRDSLVAATSQGIEVR